MNKEMLLNNETNQKQLENYKFNIVKPGGNDTCIIIGKVDNPIERKRLNDLVMEYYSNVEQVGFLESDNLTMAGGEFCGNATRSAALLLLKGNPGEIKIKVSGVENYLKAGVKENGETYSEMPIFNSPDKVISIERNNPSEILVEMEGISHLINFNYQQIEKLSPNEIKTLAKNRIDELNLNKLPAAGVVYVKQEKGQYFITPVVYVRDIDTLFLETACGSGTTALGLVLAKNKGSSINNIPVIQPSGMPIKISVDYNGIFFNSAFIEGPVELISSGELNNNYATEKIETRNQLESAFSQGLPQLFIEIFSQPPYQEKFFIDEAKSFFQDYLSYGNIFICKNQKEIIGFSASIPLVYEEEVSKLVSPLNIKNEDTTYFAELGVANNYRKQGIGINLTKKIINSAPIGKNILLRTSENNNNAIPLYEKLGFKQLPIFQEVEQARVDGLVNKDRRVFYYLKQI